MRQGGGDRSGSHFGALRCDAARASDSKRAQAQHNAQRHDAPTKARRRRYRSGRRQHKETYLLRPILSAISVSSVFFLALSQALELFDEDMAGNGMERTLVRVFFFFGERKEYRES